MDTKNLETTWNEIIENASNRKVVFQSLLTICKQSIEKADQELISKTIVHNQIQKVLKDIYTQRILNFCPETLSFLYQLTKFAHKSSNWNLKLHLIKLIPILLGVYYYNLIESKIREKQSSEGLEVLFLEISKFDESTKSDNKDLDQIVELFPNVQAVSDASKKIQLPLKQEKTKTPTKTDSSIRAILSIFNSHMLHYQSTDLALFLTLAIMVGGGSVNIHDFGIDKNQEFKFEGQAVFPYSVHQIIVKEFISGVRSIITVNSKLRIQGLGALELLSSKALGNGQIENYLLVDTYQSSQLTDIFS